MAKLHVFANSGDPDPTPHSVASDLGLHCLPVTLLRSLATRPIYKYVCHFFFFFYFFFFSFIFYFLIQCLASLWVNFSSVVVSEIYWPSQKRNCSCSFHWVVIVCG